MTEQLNIFKTLGITKNENIHSEFLAWLLSPYENHGLGSKFFTKIIEKLRENCENCEALNAIKIDNDNDLPYLKVAREFSYKNNENNENSDCGRFDIFIRNSIGDNKFVCLIENKIESPLGNEQLERYKKFLDKWGNYKKLYLFLSPKNDYCKWDNEKGYININYKFIKDVLANVIKKEEITNNNTKSVIEQYLEIIPTTKEPYKYNDEKFVWDNKNGESRFEPKDENEENKNYYYTITPDEKLGICIRPKDKDKNPNIELIEKFEKEYEWKEKVYINKEGYYWVLKDLNNIDDISDIIGTTEKIFDPNE